MMEIDELRELIDKLIKESSDLANKIFKLENVLYTQKGPEQFTRRQLALLNIQLMSMRTYYNVLRARIEDLDNQVNKMEDKR